ncbi:unnamed protein product [Lupinus luteus]|uniref:DUF4219 domain-containing protein n=1 Tax=Lupinus luteus TaxID=3873 RepID=A0AAV1XJV0_LUPLU
MGYTSTNLPTTLPILDSKNWNRWSIQVKAIMGFQEIEDIVEDGYSDVDVEATKAQKLIYKENRKKDCKTMCLIHQCVDEAHFEKIGAANASKEAWKILEGCNKGAEQLKKVRLQTMRRQYELMQMDVNERISQFFNRIISHTNQMKACGEVIHDQTIIEKILRTLTPNFDHIVVAIEESKNLEEFKLEELQGSLEAHEQRIIERSTGKYVNQALQVQTYKKGGYSCRGGNRSQGKVKECKGKGSSTQEQERFDQNQSVGSSRRGGLNS